ncbi:hypothetical protein FRACYDRAFT_224679 [Fragilariopsis cylindrus CCMP1102]|uniref:Uncharacterized protein n=1 Tax=Fragilariopsis cylindrus CCMP1102 TaxID=635003 RepID=A0A1E7FQU4_9STRA|nr:hypothetical protein FRACYDRAFT_224679 [Fragilariopsis cylindrus CCMP1102]|eukprot:OEU20163.1 hypothetical protein FRACYDRAFT_224679 [Fragilariopsis cylindrus CCMP1102]
MIAAKANNNNNNDSDDDSSESSSDDEGDLVLEGVLVRNPDASDSSSSDDDDDDDDGPLSSSEDEGEDEEEDSKPPASKKQKQQKQQDNNNNKKDDENPTTKTTKKQKNKKHKKQKKGPEIVPMEFTFCDMNKKFFHGIKALLTSSSPIYLSCNSSNLTDLMITNVAIGTVISTIYEYKNGMVHDPEYDNVVYGFASVLNVTTHQHTESINYLKKICLQKCPSSKKQELEIVLSGTTKRPCGFLFQCRMVNLPLEIVDVLHSQLLLDMDHAINNTNTNNNNCKDHEEQQRKALDYGVFIRIAPTYKEGTTGTYYKYFDDEILANHSEYTYEIELPKTYGMEETPYCTVIVLTKLGHRSAIQNLKNMVNGGL